MVEQARYQFKDGEVMPFTSSNNEVFIPPASQQKEAERENLIQEAINSRKYQEIDHDIARAFESANFVADFQRIMDHLKALEHRERSQNQESLPEVHLLSDYTKKFLNSEGIQLLYHQLAKMIETKLFLESQNRRYDRRNLFVRIENFLRPNGKEENTLWTEGDIILSNLLAEIRQRII